MDFSISFWDALDQAVSFLSGQLTYMQDQFGPAVFIPLSILVAVGVMAQWALYEKCDLPGYACLVPGWNVIVFLKIMGRPASHIWYFIAPLILIPILFIILEINLISLAIAGVLMSVVAFFTIRVYIELCHCFGKKSWYDYLFVIFFNGIYILSLGLSQDLYKGPVYKK